jgi:hypothetical protein
MPPVPPMLGWTIAAVATAALGRLLVREWRRVNEMLDAQELSAATGELQREAFPTLRPDPRTGVYRPE